MTIFVDMDGVVANFEGKAIELFGADWKSEIEKPNWGRVSEIQNLYETLEPMPDAHELWDYLKYNFDDVQILTAIPKRAHFPEVVNHKRAWVHRHFGPVRVNFGPYAFDKQFHCRTSDDILIDDTAINCNQWIEADGRAILHTSASNTIHTLEIFNEDQK